MSSAARRVFLLGARQARPTAATARRAYASIPTKNPSPTLPTEPSQEQAMPIGRYYEAILNTPQPIAEKKPEEPATSVKEAQQAAEPQIAAEPEAMASAPAPAPTPAKRGRKPKEPKTEPVSTATAATAPTASATKSSGSNGSRNSSSKSRTATSSAAKVIFGSRLVGPAERAERLAEIRSRSKMVAGILVPPRPEEPDNCCMSGCVNCVWDRYRDEMEAWASANSKAERRLRRQQDAGVGAAAPLARDGKGRDHASASMDDDGGGSETNWGIEGPDQEEISKDFWNEELFRNIPVGIREFMKQEQRLKEKHIREGTSGG